MAEGRGAWDERGKGNGSTMYERIKDTPKDGEIPEGASGEELTWYESVNFGVQAIQSLLGIATPSGMFGNFTRKRIRTFQEMADITADGIVGPETMARMLRPVVNAACGTDVDPKWIWGLARQESALDPGAQGESTPADRGIWQFNTEYGVTPAVAHDVIWAADAVCRRWRGAWRDFAGKGQELRIDCSIMQHRSPVAAQYLFDHGLPYGPDSAKYVRSVRELAAGW